MARKRAAYSDLQGVPAHLVAEIVDGELVTSPRPAPRHARAASSLGGELYGPFDRGGDREVGSFSTSQSCTCPAMLSFLTWAACVVSACLRFRR